MKEFVEKISKKFEKIKIIKICFDIYLKYFEIFNYLIAGGIATIVNIVTYAITEKILNWNNVGLSTWFAWGISVVVAYILNKLIVFETVGLNKKELLKEIFSFLILRLLSGLMDRAFMYITVEKLLWPDILMKVISNIVVIILNYIFSKLIIFKKKNKKNIDN